MGLRTNQKGPESERRVLSQLMQHNAVFVSRTNEMSKEQLRPPVYNPEDYAVSLKKWTRNNSACNGSTNDNSQDNIISSQSLPAINANAGEMSLRQFSSVMDLLNKLKNDLRLAYSSFVQEFIADPIDGVSLLLDLLRSMQSQQSNQRGRVSATAHRRSQMEEYTCLLCLHYCLRCQDASRRMSVTTNGLYSIAACIMSSTHKSRIITLELLTKVCNYSGPGGKGHTAVSEAMTTLRLRFGEPTRFRFLVGMLSGANQDLLLAGLRFINTFLETSPNKQMQLYVQAELEQAGFQLEAIKKNLLSREQLDNQLTEEMMKWSKLYIDVEELRISYDNKCKAISSLKEKIAHLESKIKVLEEQKQTLSSEGVSLKERCSDLENQLLTLQSVPSGSERSEDVGKKGHNRQCEGNSTPAEDEGISSSDQDDCLELSSDVNKQAALPKTELSNHSTNFKVDKCSNTGGDETVQNFKDTIPNAHHRDMRMYPRYRPNGQSANELRSEALVLDAESDIIPTKILPEPPRRSRSLFLYEKDFEINPFFEDDESFDNSTSTCSTPDCAASPSGSQVGVQSSPTIYRRTKINSQQPSIRRSETFHNIQTNAQTFRNIETNIQCFKRGRPDFLEQGSYTTNKGNSNNYTKAKPDKNYSWNQQNCRPLDDSVNKKNLSDPGKGSDKMEDKPIKRVLRSVSTRAVLKPPIRNDSNTYSYFNVTTSSTPPLNYYQHSFKKHNNAGLYSGKHNTPDTHSSHLQEVVTVTPNYRSCYLNGLRSSINLNFCNNRNGTEKIMDLPSGLY